MPNTLSISYLTPTPLLEERGYEHPVFLPPSLSGEGG